MKPNPIPADIADHLEYQPETGMFRWKHAARGRKKLHWAPATAAAHGYAHIKYRLKSYPAHRIAFLLMTGHEAPHDIDHINGNRRDNRWANLRPATRSQNNANRPGSKGYTVWNGKYVATIKHQKRCIYLGRYDTAQQAHDAYIAARKRIFGEFAYVPDQS